MEQEIIKSLNYEVGDVVYLAHDEGCPICKAEALELNEDIWRFKPLEKQSIYAEKDGIIEFSGKPFVFAKETDERRAENDTI